MYRTNASKEVEHLFITKLINQIFIYNVFFIKSDIYSFKSEMILIKSINLYYIFATI